MELEFTKLHGLGNDFIVIDDLSSEIQLSIEQVIFLCDRHFGIGADGIILVRPSTNNECAAFMHYINSDGSLADMCGNGIRCFAKYLVDRGFVLSGDGSFTADTPVGPRHITFTVDQKGYLQTATVNMGAPRFKASQIPTLLAPSKTAPMGESFICEVPLDSPWGSFSFTCISFGNPHAVCFVDRWNEISDSLFAKKEKKLETFLIDKIGAFFESHTAFPEKANIEFAEVLQDGIHLRVYERGCGETYACGTGACATHVASVVTERGPIENEVKLKGGILHVCWEDYKDVFMTGPAEEVYTGKIFL